MALTQYLYLVHLNMERTFQSITSVLFSKGISNGMNEHQVDINRNILNKPAYFEMFTKKKDKKRQKKYIYTVYIC